MKNLKLKTIATSATVGLLFVANSALAAPIQPGTTVGECSVTSLTIAGQNSTACEGIFSGNDSNQDAFVAGLFGGTYNWTEVAKTDLDPEDDGDNSDNSAGYGLSFDTGVSGNWSVSDWNGLTSAMIVLKAGPTFSAFLISDTSVGLGGMFDTLSNLTGGPNGRPGPGLSHAALYAGEDVNVVPLPASGLLLLAGLGGMAAVRRKRRS